MFKRQTAPPQPDPGRRGTRLFWALALAVMVISCFAVTRGTMQMIHAQEELAAIHEVNAGLKASNSILLRKVENLRTNRIAIEAIIRQDLGMVKPNEIVYIEPESNGLAAQTK